MITDAGENSRASTAATLKIKFAKSRFFDWHAQLFVRRDLSEVSFLIERLEASLQVVWQGRRVVQRAGVQPDSIGSVAPGLCNRDAQEVLAQSASEEFLQQSEVSYFD